MSLISIAKTKLISIVSHSIPSCDSMVTNSSLQMKETNKNVKISVNFGHGSIQTEVSWNFDISIFFLSP